jgi:hypothetical protein
LALPTLRLALAWNEFFLGSDSALLAKNYNALALVSGLLHQGRLAAYYTNKVAQLTYPSRQSLLQRLFPK